ncbi:MAG: T9SS type A sorting domain-containing protein [Bacteroidota bacterium]
MKAFFTSVFLLFAVFAHATVHDVEVGGFPGGPAPFYAPQQLTIQLGDTVLWTWSGGFHNVTSTSGPVSFASGSLSAPATFQFVFTTAGVYDYECTVGSHSLTQFGTITVLGTVSVDEALSQGPEVSVYPNPMESYLTVEIAEAAHNGTLARLYEAGSGKLVREFMIEGEQHRMPAADLPAGQYIMTLRNDEGETAVRLVKY